ncbi:hypothetical protein N7495_008953 [Penicillium taxi]|uniref:uncharacterized protein n=1 Tax=Penicillium taxi TaxID=168475 RepID=UPI002545737F|nr:uncharacterized protein N7495_008953 [Penicillium taxi]KAJ5888912.1 hypothetical protein N7495_008953 [Penicillium taxi]
MSTQVPQVPVPRNRRQKKTSTPHGHPPVHKQSLIATPPSSPPQYTAANATDQTHAHSKKKNPRSGVKPYRNSPANTTPQPKDAAYAGPTFHASPAPSALPIPSFFSKSFPESDLAPTLEVESDNAETDVDFEATPSKPRARPQTMGEVPEATPLDFLFKAAVEARKSSPMNSPEMTRFKSPQTEPRRMQLNPPGGVFDFDMDNHSRAHQIGPSFAPSYQDRMNALRRSDSSYSQPEYSETEEQKRINTEALKHALLNPPVQKARVSPAYEHPHNYAQQRPNINATIPPYATPLRSTSGPAMTYHHGYPQGYQQSMPNNAGYHQTPYQHSNGQRARNVESPYAESPLRRELPAMNGYHSETSHNIHYVTNGSAHAHSHAHVPHAYALPSQQRFNSPRPQYTTAAFDMPTNSPSVSKPVDTQQIEDQIRRALKLG